MPPAYLHQHTRLASSEQRIVCYLLVVLLWWKCSWCGNEDAELQVHHGYYARKRRDPHEYPTKTLHSLCDKCHERAEAAKASLYYELAKIHPKHHWEVRRLLREVQKLIRRDGTLLEDAALITDTSE